MTNSYLTYLQAVIFNAALALPCRPW